MHLAVGRKKPFDEAIAVLMKHDDIEVDALNKNLASPLHLAALWGHTDVAKLLIERGADPKRRTKKKVTPTQMALDNERNETAQVIAAAAGEELPADGTPRRKGHKTAVRHVDSPQDVAGWSDKDQAAFDKK